MSPSSISMLDWARQQEVTEAKLLERALALLGKSIDDPSVRSFPSEIGETPVSASAVFLFRRAGISLICMSGVVVAVFFRINCDADAEWECYTGQLPGGIGVEDLRKDVAAKLGAPVNSEPSKDRKGKVRSIDDEFLFKDLVIKVAFDPHTEVVQSVVIMLPAEDIERIETNRRAQVEKDQTGSKSPPPRGKQRRVGRHRHAE